MGIIRRGFPCIESYLFRLSAVWRNLSNTRFIYDEYLGTEENESFILIVATVNDSNPRYSDRSLEDFSGRKDLVINSPLSFADFLFITEMNNAFCDL